MNSEVEYFIDERDCIACQYYENKLYEDPCYACYETKNNNTFKPDSIDNIIDRISEL